MLNKQFTKILKNFSYTLISNLSTFLISLIVALIVPKVISVEEYGLFQVFLFYTTFTGALHLGWNDGIYLRFGGEKYENLDKSMFFSQFWMQVVMQTVMASIAFLIVGRVADSTERIFIFRMLAVYMLLINIRGFFLLLLQATNRIKDYSSITILFRIPYFFIVMGLLFFEKTSYQSLIIADIAGLAISTAIAIYKCRDIVFRKFQEFRPSFSEIFENIRVGSKLLFANFAGLLILGSIRFGIDRNWDDTTFGKTSLAITASNMMMLFISAVAIVVFPLLKRTAVSRYPTIYTTIRNTLMIGGFGLLLLYYPAKYILVLWLPQYTESLRYMAILFPIFLFDGKTSMITNTYFKALRHETKMFHINIISCIVSVISTVFITYVFHNIHLAILLITLMIVFRATLAEIIITRIINVPVYKEMTMEILLCALFIIAGWFFDNWYAPLIYGLGYLLYLFVRRKDFLNTFKRMRGFMKRDSGTDLESKSEEE